MSLHVQKIERLILGYLNKERRKRGLSPLTRDGRLQHIARKHSAAMARSNRIWHGSGTKIAGGFAGENCHMMPTGRILGFKRLIKTEKDIALAMHVGWMKSRGHRENILNRNYNSVGIGVKSRGNKYYATQLFKDRSIFDMILPEIRKALYRL